MKELFEMVATAFEAAAVIVLLLGVLIAAGRYLIDRMQRGQERHEAYRTLRQGIGRALLLALELLVAADIIDTVAVEPSLENLGRLGLLVLIRTFLSFSLELEIDGRWPWQSKREASDKGVRVRSD